MTSIDKTYYINLKHRKDRNSHVIKEFSKTKKIKSYERFEAVDGKTIDIDQLDSKFITTEGKNITILNKIKRWGIDLTYGSVGCALSHYLLYQECVKNSYEAALIFEDDIVIYPEIDRILDKITELDSNSFDILYLGYHNNPQCTKLSEDFSKINSLVYGAFAYIVTLNGAKKILNKVFPISKQFDSEISSQIRQNNLFCIMSNVRVVKTSNSFGTDNQGKFGLKVKSSIYEDNDPWTTVVCKN